MVQQRGARLAAAALIGLGGLVGAGLSVPSYAGEDGHSSEGAPADMQPFLREQSGADGHGHSHDDPATENLLSRSEEASSPAAADPTTPQQAATNRAAARAMRSEPVPRLGRTSLQAPRYRAPRTRYEMAGGCYGLRALSNGRWVRRTDSGVRADGTRSTAASVRFKATDLGRYLLMGRHRAFLGGSGTTVSWSGSPSNEGNWTVRRRAGRFSFKVGSGFLTAARGGAVTLSGKDQGTPSRFALERVGGCAAFPEIGVNVSGRPFTGVTRYQQTYGTADAHTHGMAFEFLGGKLHCGRPWHRFGVTFALQDCEDHSATDGKGGIIENFLSDDPDGHDPVGWPTFKDWPAPHSLTHEGTYYKWMERSWRGGLRLFTNLLVENNQLCQLYPYTATNPKWQKAVAEGNKLCDDMVSLKWQADDMRTMQRYIDAQYGGPGRGWYRIVTNPFQARRVINSGRMAVVMGIETSVPFRCSIKPNPDPTKPDQPLPEAGCDKASVDGWVARVHRWGVRQMELVNKFDNAFSGITGDEGATGVLVNSANQAETGSAWRMSTCDGKQAGFGDQVHDKDQVQSPSSLPDALLDPFPQGQQDVLFGAVIAAVSGLPATAPVYGPHHHCNRLGLSTLGTHLVRRLASRGMLFDPDHMSVKGRKAALSVMESMRYPGVISSHSWSTPDAYPRILKMGGFIAPYAGDSAGFVDKWRALQNWTDSRYFFGVGYGADINGLGAQGDPRNPTTNKVTYPFTGLGGVTVRRNQSGKRVYDINTDGVAHYGLYPDWLQDLRKQAGAPITDDMARGAEAYLQTWERAVGVDNDACRQPSVRKPLSLFRGLALGSSTTRVLLRAGQPHRRLGSTFGYCARNAAGDTRRVRLTFGPAGRLRAIDS